jgi:ankyrin repeat protein
MRSLLQRKEIDLNARTQSYGHTALTLLTRYNQLPNLLDCIQLLLERDANVDITVRKDKNALNYLCEFYELNNLMDIAKLIVSKMVRFPNAGIAVEMLKKRGYHKESKVLAEVIKSRIKELQSAQ